jgi:hypothetical protein
MIQQRGHPDKAPQPGRIVAPARGVCTCDNGAHGAEFTNLTLFGDHTWLTARWITGAKRRRHDQFGAPTAKMRRHTAPGSIRFSTRWLDRALADFELTLQLNPNFSLARCYCDRWRKACESSAAGKFGRVRAGGIAGDLLRHRRYAQLVGRNYPAATALAREETHLYDSHVGIADEHGSSSRIVNATWTGSAARGRAGLPAHVTKRTYWEGINSQIRLNRRPLASPRR